MNHIYTSLHPIHFFNDMQNIWETILQSNTYSQILILTDSNTTKYCLPEFKAACPNPALLHDLEMPAGEEYKNLKTAQTLWEQMLELGTDRFALLINLGGGVVSDIGGWVAANYKRGIATVNIPTTLLAMVDASAGGKTAINCKGLKNMIGLFSPPQAVYICPAFLNTLPRQQLQNGFAEMIKHALIADENYWEALTTLPSLDTHHIHPLLYKSIAIKAGITDQDPYEKNERKKLNFGHTIGHLFEHWALEDNTHTLLHGEAVALGLWVESYLSMQKMGLSFAEADAIMHFIGKHFKKYPLPKDKLKDIPQILLHDKKTQDKQWHFTLLTHIGQAETNCICQLSEVEEALMYYQNHY